ncbi:hypothetical protein F0365_02905 [Nonlabens sp. Ci31]|jgi:hypothetical protein|uniref:DUF6364 family protein n=1 Tax=Nonlabens sp. Ci31 TaxID=2608253 RepID=UPI00146336BA|nr:DUF6364 family protein [Nonlabens sp. Ci31]QJP33430.1 hypothetical protein F0365_02905 [Nonlabens sp. Ci31]
MNRKLTLTVEEEIIIKAKAYAKETGRSLSDLVQNYLDKITKDYSVHTDLDKIAEEPSRYRKMAGIITSNLDPVKDRDELRDISLEKYNR